MRSLMASSFRGSSQARSPREGRRRCVDDSLACARSWRLPSGDPRRLDRPAKDAAAVLMIRSHALAHAAIVARTNGAGERARRACRIDRPAPLQPCLTLDSRGVLPLARWSGGRAHPRFAKGVLMARPVTVVAKGA